jgi:putative hemolysin
LISVERSFYERFPRFSSGKARSLSQPVVGWLRRIVCEERINAILEFAGTSTGYEFVERVLEYLKISYSVANTDRENIPVEGRVVIVANHPLGALDALALIHLVGSVRRDVKILANDVLMKLEPLAPLLLPLPVFGNGNAIGGAREAFRALERDEAVIVFPAGEVSRMRPQGVRDTTWSSGFARMALKTDAPVLPVHITAQNSSMFYGVSMIAKPLSSLLLPREIFLAEHARIGFQIGEIIAPAALTSVTTKTAQIAQDMRQHVYRLPRRRPTVFPTSAAVAHPESPLRVRAALREAAKLGQTNDGKQILLLEAKADCPALREIGRLRELAFRRVGEGTGARRDLDRYDSYYRHLVLWDEPALAIVGAYRLGEAGPIMQERGIAGLYSASLFDYAPAAAEFLPEAVELGRSFVQPAYWGSRSLDYLWQGIGAYLRSQPQIRYLIGPVSLSATLAAEAREWIVHYHRHYFCDNDRLARARNPFVISDAVEAAAAEAWSSKTTAEGLVVLKERLTSLGAQLPVLYRQYADLCEPAGVRFLDFGIDPAFGGCVDGLVRLDLHQLRPNKRARYVDTSRNA